MTSLEPLKFVVQAVLAERDDAGVIRGERVAEPVTLYGVDQLADFVDRFPDELAKLQPSREAGAA